MGLPDYKQTLLAISIYLIFKTFKHGHGKVNMHTCVSTKLLTKHKRSFNKVVIRHFCKISFKDFENQRNPKICMHVFSCMLQSFHVHGHESASNFSSPGELPRG